MPLLKVETTVTLAEDKRKALLTCWACTLITSCRTTDLFDAQWLLLTLDPIKAGRPHYRSIRVGGRWASRGNCAPDGVPGGIAQQSFVLHLIVVAGIGSPGQRHSGPYWIRDRRDAIRREWGRRRHTVA